MPHTRLAALPLSPASTRGRPFVAGLVAVGMLALTGCASPDVADPATTETAAANDEQPHGFVAGAEELSEAQSSIASIGADGSVNVLNLLTGEIVELDSVQSPSWAVSDGRFVFSGVAPSESGAGRTEIIDTGVWTVPHGDHVHYYRAAPGLAGEILESGPASVASNEGIAALSYATSGTTVVLDRHALGQGETIELARIESAPHDAAAAPVGDAVVASSVVAPGAVPTLDAYSLDGEALGAGVECPGLSDVQATSLGATFSCSDGLVFASAPDAAAEATAPTLTKVEYPTASGASPDATIGQASTLDSRPHRPAAAGPAGEAGIWLAASRSQDVTFIPTTAPILTAVAVGDDSSRVVAVDNRGTLLVIDGESGEVTGTQAGLVGSPETASSLHLSVDTSRAYLGTSSSAELSEIDYKDGARVARTLTLPSAPAFAFETGN
ncbi:hypothetical protein C5B85_00510 [Pseudoclavibacter sp. AY1F1]|uniref:hypothetical protein n=1 Tax=Pseudoclavibacter sp. AY1F1 TaxID=2080583 RepID=UPI000CE7217A|nr:hypothetical protein [Pseudoclavibacter sp. AY1F1]PPF46809.1 hypothetical protein C5B85_00510 [Pseudoclavibacter sp. AY1F1]